VKFGPIEKIDEVYFESSYYLAPSKGAEKLYRFLAKTLEKTGRVAVKEAHDERGDEKKNCCGAKGEMGES
jgi:non-homologous end joining protein Ku